MNSRILPILALILTIFAAFSASTSGNARFLQTDPVGYEADMNLYAYSLR